MRKSVIVFLLLLSFIGVNQGEEVFTTTGSDGEKVYSDKPVGNASKITLRFPRPPVSDTPENKTDTGPSLAEMSPCEQARYIVARYTRAEVLAEKDDNGNTRILDAAEASAMIERAQADEKRLCEEQEDEYT